MKNKIIAILLTFSLTFSFVFMLANADNIKLGDVNNDGKVNASDARLTLRAAASLEKFSEEQKIAADINFDNKINASDARLILRIASKLDPMPEIPTQETTTDKTTDPTTELEPDDSSKPSGDATAPDDSSKPSNDATIPEDTTSSEMPKDPSKEDILKKYAEVMDQLKAEVATYDKQEFQTLSDDYALGTIGNLILPIAHALMTNEYEAKIQKRNDMEQIPIIRNEKGCLLTDVSAIKSATITENGGKTTIVIVLNDEKNPLPAANGATSCDSAIGSMFNPLDQAQIDDIVAQFSGVVTMNKFELTGKDCTATLVFDTASGKVESLEQIMNYFIEFDSKAVIVPVSGYATLTNKMTINNVAYK